MVGVLETFLYSLGIPSSALGYILEKEKGCADFKKHMLVRYKVLPNGISLILASIDRKSFFTANMKPFTILEVFLCSDCHVL
jgi:hypothetical protein